MDKTPTSRIETLPSGAMVSSTFRKPASKFKTNCLKCGRGCLKSEINAASGGNCYTCSPIKAPTFDFGANDRLGDALEIATKSTVPGAKLIVSRSERGWCVLWAMASTSYETLRRGLEALRDGGTLDYENRRIICPRAADPAIQL